MNVEQLQELLLQKRKKIVVGVVGSRRRASKEDVELLYNHILTLKSKALKSNCDLHFVSGGCKEGADAFIKVLCSELHFPLVEHLPEKLPADASYHERVKAYYARNFLIARDCNFLIAMISPDRKGGTENTIVHCYNLKKKVILI